ncbi:MAG: GMC family oxidoreductase [Gammaproteobacteria bacterium]|nr:GMC family oxidoreductase [Gammaproteobacteria bacterium]MCP5458369.1 GMC family oxidoreductase [Gammaproteobacteria bacterium]
MNEHYDILIVGSGAGGSAAAYSLTRAGHRVLLLEKGGELPRDGSTLDVDKVIRQGIFKSKEPWLDRNGHVFEPEEYFNLGGKTKWYGAALIRFERHEFEAEPAYQYLPWPIGYDDMEPYYEQAESLLTVQHFALEPDLRTLVGKLTRNGAGWDSRPLGLALDPTIVDDPTEAAHFDAFASVKNLKSDGEHAMLEHVRRAPNLTILTGRPVSHFIFDTQRPERLLGARVADGSEFRADTVLLAAGALHSPRLLQTYLRDSGLADKLPCADAVGRHFKRHLLSAVLAFTATPKTDLLRKTVLLLNQRTPHSSIQPLGFDGELLSTLIPGFVPRGLARALGRRAYGFFLQTEDGSDPANRVVAKTDGAEYPLLDYDSARMPAALEEHRRLVRTFNRSLMKIGIPAAAKGIPLAGTAHACGTLVAGNDPRHSVVDADGKVHGLENLYVVDGSVLPRSSRGNPSLTIYAWALRVADRLAIRSPSA